MLSRIGIESRSFDRQFCFKSYGVNIGLASDSDSLLEKAYATIEAAFGGEAEIFESPIASTQSVFGLSIEDGRFLLYKDGRLASYSDSEHIFFKYLNSLLRLEVAEFASDLVFIHAGVVGWRNGAIVMPGTSFAGKSTLTAELVRLGARYYSDEYAVVGGDGRIRPFPRHLSLRDDATGCETNAPVEDLGGERGVLPLSAGLILFTEYREGSRWDPKQLTVGAGVMELVPHTLNLRRDPAFSMKVLDLMTRNAIMLKSPRGDVKEFAKFLLEFFDNNTKLAKMT